jgi:Fic family protein
MKSEMKNNLNGMFWEPAGLNFKIPHAGNTKNAIYVFQKNIVPITWNCMTTLERNPTTLPQTETILKGQSVSGISIDQLMQVKNYGDGAKKLVELLSNGTFALNEKTASALHQYVAKEDALTWGTFRNSDIAIRGVGYIPPNYTQLSKIAEKGFSFLSSKVEVKEAAIATFLFMSRSQFFHDANKRTSSLMMNGSLIKHGYYPITVMNRDSEEFHNKLTDFYNSGDATSMMKFFEKTVEKIYQFQEKEKNHKEIKSKNDLER